MSTGWRQQRRSRRIAMTPEERDAFLVAERTCRVATASPDGRPHVSPLWFVWDGSALWLYSIVKSRRWSDLERNPRCSVVVDAGDAYSELRGVELAGTVEVVGEAPRTGETSPPDLAQIERRFSEKYRGTPTMDFDGRHGWLKLTPEREYTCDFRKLAS